MSARVVHIAACQYPIGRPTTFEAYADSLWKTASKAADADLLLFPEYGAMELASIFGPDVESDLDRQVDAVSDLRERVDQLHQDIARTHDAVVLAASLPVRLSRTKVVNRARLFAPSGRSGYQDKQIMTRFEREEWGISSGSNLRVFETAFGRVGIAICYDCEFPLIGRAMADAGAEIILIPSCTDTVSGSHRVRIGAMARALESQIVTVVSPTIGDAPWLPSVDVNRGFAGIYGPADSAITDTGVLAEGTPDTAQWVTAAVDLTLFETARADGEVLASQHWREQPGIDTWALPTVDIVDLR